MAVIHILDKAVAELIAAGEVVERPASIVKELVENAVDAGADSITVEIEDGGISLIRVIDNGCGIPPEEMPKAFLRHATSKLKQAEDLDSILTLGFRGEALASIAAMCKVELISKPPEALEGACCYAQGGVIDPVQPAGCPDGTSITVRDVFFNTPARMKFLKKNTSEAGAVAQVVDKCALAHPEIAFRFRRDGKITLQTSGNGDLQAVIYAIYGKDLAEKMIPVEYTGETGIRVSGCISRPEEAKPSRTYQTFYINSRYVRTRTAMAALEQAYKDKLPSGRFPACVLDIHLDASSVDVNVHPAKIEVRFADEKPVFNAVYFAVKSALAKIEQPFTATVKAKPILPTPVQKQTLDQLSYPLSQASHKPPPIAPADTIPHKMTSQEFRVLFAQETDEKPSFSAPISFHASRTLAKPDIFVEDLEDFGRVPPSPTKSAKIQPTSEDILAIDHAATCGKSHTAILSEPEDDEIQLAENPAEPKANYRLIGELFGTYILLETEGAFVLVDKHAAHERILYEQLKDNLTYGNRQVLLSSQTITLPREEYVAVIENLDALQSMGFLVEDFGGGTVIVRETPIELGQQDIVYVLSEIADKLRRGLRDVTPKVLDRLYYSIACRSAVKARDKNTAPELIRIVELLQQNPQITHCPHGRPVWARMTRREIEKLFGRQ